MTKQQTIKADATSAAILQIPLEMLYISDLNPRKAVSDAHIESLADSIERFGLIHNLAGLMDEDGKVGIVAGGCRLRAVQMIAERSKAHPFTTLPVKLAADATEAEDWASAENAAREDMTPADEICAFGRMKSRGASVPEIALAFAVTEARVYQRLALAGLPEPVLEALAAGEISLGTAKAFTLSDDEALTLNLLDQVKGQAVSESAIKNALHPDAIKATDRRAKFVGLETYEAEGGTVTRDLFSDEVFLASPALLDRLLAEKLEAARADLVETQAWAWAETRSEAWLNYYELDQMKLARLYPIEGDLSEEETQEYDELADLANGGVLDEDGEARLSELQAILDGDYSEDQKAHAGCIILVNGSGKPEITAGLVRPEDKKAAIEAGVLQAPQTTKSDTPKSPYSQKLVADMQAIRLASVQAALLAKPELVLDLLGFGLSEASGSFESVFGIRLDRPTNAPSVEDGFVQEPRLEHGIDASEYWQKDFVAFLLGCSFTFETALLRENIPVRHVELGCNVPMYRTNVACEPSGPFTGPLVVSMRPMTLNDADRAVVISSRFPGMHGAPVQVGSPEQIGITDLAHPDYGDAVPIEDEEIPVFWACGVTPQAVLQQARLPLVLTHSPGCMFVSDKRDEEYEV